jgi:monoamine oxidase
MDGVRVIVVGAGLAGLAAAYELSQHGADVTIVEARRDRIGGRVWTRRDFTRDQHAEAGGDLIEAGHTTLIALARELGCEPIRILRSGFSYYRAGAKRPDRSGGAWTRLEEMLRDEIDAYRISEERWDSGIAMALAAQSVSDWLAAHGADRDLEQMAVALRGFFLADPSELSLLALVDQLAAEDPASEKMFRLRGGNDTLVQALASRMSSPVRLGTAAVAVSQGPSQVRVRVRDRSGALDELSASYAIFAVPATTLRDVVMDPPLPQEQQEAIAKLPYGPATRVLAQFDRRFWRSPKRTRAFGTDLAVGAIWDANEEQGASPGILSFLAGGSASAALQRLLALDGVDALRAQLDWLSPGRARVLAWNAVTWEDDPWAQGGYAAFRTTYNPQLRAWLARPHGRVFFAGEHTSERAQGYMNGAVETGQRAACEVRLAASAAD